MVRGALSAALDEEHLLFVTETGGDPRAGDPAGRGPAGPPGRRLRLRVDCRPGWSPSPAALAGHPVVLLNCLTGDGGLPAVLPDERAAGRDAARVLLERGHRDGIVVLGETPPGGYAARERLAGIEEALAAAGTALAGVLECAWWPEPAHDAVAARARARAAPRALICLNDRIAFGAYQAAREAGLAIPDQLSVVSFDDSDLAGWLRPELTSVALPHYELGRRAVRLLLAADPDTAYGPGADAGPGARVGRARRPSGPPTRRHA